jgi:simple sugar transport system permease protein
MAVAVLGRNNPAGVVVAAVLFGALRSGGMLLDRSTSIPGDFVVIIQALVIIFVATPGIIKALRIRRGGKNLGK